MSVMYTHIVGAVIVSFDPQPPTSFSSKLATKNRPPCKRMVSVGAGHQCAPLGLSAAVTVSFAGYSFGLHRQHDWHNNVLNKSLYLCFSGC